MKNVCLLVLFAALTFNIKAQLPFYWARTDDTTYSGFRQKMITDANGNIYVGGSPSYMGKTIGKIIKYDQYGNNLWAKTDTGAGLGVYINDICIDSNNDLYVAGRQQNSGTGFDAYLYKYSSNGQLLWKKYYNGTADSTDDAASITYFNSYLYLSGATVGLQNHNRVLLQKYDMIGNLIWTVTDSLNEQWDNSAFYITHDSSNLIVTGMVWHSQMQYNMFLAKYDQAGNKIWQIFDSLSVLRVYGGKIVIDHQQNIYIAVGADYVQYNLLKYDSLGRFEWGFGITPSSFTSPPGIADVKLDESDNVYLSGTAAIAGGFDGMPTFVFTKLRPNGSVVGSYVGQNYGYGAGFDFLSQNDMVVSGSLDTSGYEIIDFDSSVNIKWEHYYTNDVPLAICYQVVVDSMKNILLAGSRSSYQAGGSPSMEVIKYGSNPFVTGLNILNGEQVDIKVFPNPGAPGTVQFVVSDNLVGNNLQMFDLTGRLLQQLQITDASFKFQTSNFSNGIYFYRVHAPSGAMVVGKLVVN